MTTEQVFLVKKTWKIFRCIDPVMVGDTFYSKLFTDAPSIRRLFPPNMDTQYRKLVETINMIVSKLDKQDELVADIIPLATYHADQGLRPAHYKMIGDALCWTLRHGLGKDWTPAISDAWTDCYSLVAGAMINTGRAVIK